MKTILCYGDSNTFGEIAETQGRFEYGVRWPGALAGLLGGEYYIVEAGLNGRTTVFDDPLVDHSRNGIELLAPVMLSHKPLDTLIVMLGTNDTKSRFGANAVNIAKGMHRLLTRALQTPAWKNAPDIILVSPAPLLPEFACRRLGDEFGEDALQKSREIPARYSLIAEELGVRFFEAGTVAAPSPGDGIHLNAESHSRLAKALAGFIKA